MCIHGTAELLDGVAELPDTQTSQQTDVNETYSAIGIAHRSLGALCDATMITTTNRSHSRLFVDMSMYQATPLLHLAVQLNREHTNTNETY